MKRIMIVLIFLTAALTVFAQESDIFRFGIKAGPNLFFGSGTSDVPGYEGSRLSMGFTGGGSAELILIENLSIETDVMFTWFNYGVNLSTTNQQVTLRYSSFEIPILVKGRLPLGNGYGFLGAGPDFIFLAGQVGVILGGLDTQLATDQIFHVGLVATAGYDLMVGSDSNVTFEVRYVRTFSSPNDTWDIRANRFDILFGWSANL